MNNMVLLLHEFLTLVKSYYLVPVIVVCVYSLTYNMSIRNAAWSDIRHPPDAGFIEAHRLARLIFYERRSKRDWPTMIYCYGLPPVVIIFVVATFLG
jgi:hypothetical protein